MSEIVELVRNVVVAGWKLIYTVALIAVGYYIVDRGRKAAAVEQAEESQERAA